VFYAKFAFVIERGIAAVYLLNAVGEPHFVTLWVVAIRDPRRRRRRLPARRFPPNIEEKLHEGGK